MNSTMITYSLFAIEVERPVEVHWHECGLNLAMELVAGIFHLVKNRLARSAQKPPSFQFGIVLSVPTEYMYIAGASQGEHLGDTRQPESKEVRQYEMSAATKGGFSSGNVTWNRKPGTLNTENVGGVKVYGNLTKRILYVGENNAVNNVSFDVLNSLKGHEQNFVHRLR
ncbi:hypothetical protein B0H17DRAFT_1138461 [Mycena rosella]|uniref:Uncharacterized protein n=1 Tax=Mycena rosella TaxID=1033263 RepID=A0AAD7GDJ9_MYCRO|nr:hypothetical protein B0H17DRAFT_1138461 [Mycena rosella]